MIIYRYATLDDAEPLAALHVAAWRETYVGTQLEPLLASMSVEERAARWRRILAMRPDDPGSRGHKVLLACEGDGLVGFSSCGQQRLPEIYALGFPAEFSAIYVLKCAQGRGIGRGLMVRMSQALMRDGFSSANVLVIQDNPRARGFYEYLGGAFLRERPMEERGIAFTEIVYGWRDLSVLSLASNSAAT